MRRRTTNHAVSSRRTRMSAYSAMVCIMIPNTIPIHRNFIQNISMRKKRPPCTWIPFGVGSCICIGLRFGKMQALICLALMIKHFRFSFSPQRPAELSYKRENGLSSAVDGIHLKVEEIKELLDKSAEQSGSIGITLFNICMYAS